MQIVDNLLHYVILAVAVALTGILVAFDRIKKTGLFGSKADVAEVAFYGGGLVITRNVVTVALACSCAFSPSLVVEAIYLDIGDAIALAVARTASLCLCVVIWRRIASLGLHSISAYLFYRFDSNIAVFFYNVNSTLTFVYILIIYNGPFLYSLLEYLKLNRDGFFIFVGFLALCCFGGVRIALPLCSVLSVLELVGNIALLSRVKSLLPPTTPASDHATTSIYYCHSRNPLHAFAAALPLLLTSQSQYTLFYSVGSPKVAIGAMVAGHVVFVIKTAISLLAANTMKGYAAALGIPHYRIFHAMYSLNPGNASAGDISNGLMGGDGAMQYITNATTFGVYGTFTLNSVVYGPMAAYYALHICIFVAEVNEKYIPNLLRDSLNLTGNDIQRIYCSFYVFLACFVTFCLLSSDRYILMPHFRSVTLYLPHWTNALMSGVTAMVTVAVLVPRLRLLPVISSWSLTQFLFITPRTLLIWRTRRESVFGAMSVWRHPEVDGWTCFGVWYNFATLLANGLMLAAFPMALDVSEIWRRRTNAAKTMGESTFFKVVHKMTIYRDPGVDITVGESTMVSTEAKTFTSSNSGDNDDASKGV